MATRVIVPAPERAPGVRRLTARPETFAQRCLNAAAVWPALTAYWALADVLLTPYPPGSGGRQVAPEGWAAHAVSAGLGLIGAW